MPIERHETGARMSKAVVHGDTVYLAGIVAAKTEGQSVAEQAREILGVIEGHLQQGGTDKSKLLSATIWLTDIRTVDEFNAVWDAWVPKGSAPARACIETRLQAPGKNVEVMVVAAR
jgi:enamine deaminase RidA (YjgF/YER057c/UK114 family)